MAGETVTAALMNAHLRDNLNIIAAVGITGWTAYTATWTSSGTPPAIGNGSVGGRYCQVGKLYVAQFLMQTGSTTTYGTGTYYWATPVTLATTFRQTGSLQVTDSSAGTVFFGSWEVPTTTTLQAYMEHATATGAVTATNPMTWATGDTIRGYHYGEAA